MVDRISFVVDWRKELPTSKTINNFYELFIQDIESDIFNDYMDLDKIDIGEYYKSSYEELINRIFNMKQITKLKRTLEFNELCEFYNCLLSEYKCTYHDTKIKDTENMNRRVSMYTIILNNINEIFELKRRENKND